MTTKRSAKYTAKAVQRFCDSLRKHGVVSKACSAAGWSRTKAYEYREAFEDFANAWNEALEDNTDAIEAEAIKLAKLGELEPVWYQGKQVGKVRRKSERLMEFMLERRRYPRVTRLGGEKGAAPIPIDQQYDLSKLTDQQLEQLRALLAPVAIAR